VPARGSGLGLAGMSNRVAQAGGVLDVQSSPGAGTTLTVEVPT
jgi:signal transduction histidine kinase